MKIKTLTGTSIQAALSEARHVFGEDVVLLESIPPEGGRPARITVMADEPVTREETLKSSILAVSPTLRNARQFAGAEAAGERSREEGTRRRNPEPVFALEEAAPPAEGFSLARGGYGAARASARPAPPTPLVPPYEPAPKVREEPAPQRRGNLYPGTPKASETTDAAKASSESLMEAQLKILNDRLKALEGSFGERMIGASMQWAAHPLFAQLLERGMRPATATRLFDRIVARGHAPDSEPENIRWALAQEIRNMLDLDAPKCDSGTLLLIGPSGSGKTALALKLAKHPNFYGRRRTTVIVIEPEAEDGMAYQSPVDLYRRFGVPVQSVRTPEEMGQALERVQKFDQVIIDTPPIPGREAEARKALVNIKRITAPIMPLQTQLVINATRVVDQWNAAFIKNMPLRPDALALTHLDDTDAWGRVAEWIVSLGLPVRAASTGPRVPDSLVAFSPTWFVEEMMQL